ncbi:MAG: hypothetical protein JWQ81_2100 [Amycolatopsis sp.]|uniref:hypothetical protein n=1 Tax=Amycolatopsis sp. TaxID=37632 RepID=UPI002606729A|nr:hypothetical protein [Amycolatopsis sp.]MCU1681361.1 hypothetical protein [Amycolatopsis sp.]
MTVTAEDLDVALVAVDVALQPVTLRDWSSVPGTGELTAWQTAEHLGDCLLSYAAQLATRQVDGYVRFEAFADKEATSAQVLEFARAGGGILAATVRGAPADARAYHPSGIADPEGFAAMGCVEALVHGEDIARGLGVALDPPRDVCARVLARMFPQVNEDVDAWTALLWATDRVQLPGRGRQTGWRWRGSPLGGD